MWRQHTQAVHGYICMPFFIPNQFTSYQYSICQRVDMSDAGCRMWYHAVKTVALPMIHGPNGLFSGMLDVTIFLYPLFISNSLLCNVRRPPRRFVRSSIAASMSHIPCMPAHPAASVLCQRVLEYY